MGTRIKDSLTSVRGLAFLRLAAMKIEKLKSLPRQLLAVACIALCSRAWAAPPWNSINGFYPGMSRDQAMKAGAEKCHLGSEPGQSKSDVFCMLPAGTAKIGNVAAKQGLLQFKASNLKKVDEVTMQFKTDRAGLIGLVNSLYGKSTNEYLDTDTDAYISMWDRSGAESIVLSDRTGLYSSIYVRFQSSEATAKSRKAKRTKEAAKGKVLSGFNR